MKDIKDKNMEDDSMAVREIQQAVFIYGWFDKKNERFYRVRFNGEGELAGGYSYSKDEDDPAIFGEKCAEVRWEDGAMVVETFLKEDEEKERVGGFAIPKKWWFDSEE